MKQAYDFFHQEYFGCHNNRRMLLVSSQQGRDNKYPAVFGPVPHSKKLYWVQSEF